MNVLSLFDGMSCGQIALNRLGFKINHYFASEIKKNAIKVTQHNFPNTIQLGNILDITDKELQKLGKIDLLIGGSPCQDLSIANKERKGLKGEKSRLFWEYVRVLRTLKPKFFLLENVGGMKKDDKEIITEILGVKPIKINSQLVSAQLRNRYYWTNIPDVTIPIDRNILLQDIITDDYYTHRKKSRCLLEGESRPLTTPVKMAHRYFSTGFTTLLFKSKEHYEQCKEHYNRHYKGMAAKDITTSPEVYNGTRYLNQTELEKLQTVDVGYTSILERNQAASLLGDGWTVDVIAHLLEPLKDPFAHHLKAVQIDNKLS